jgi:hypothetical protein
MLLILHLTPASVHSSGGLRNTWIGIKAVPSAIPLAIGVALARSRRRPIAAAAQAMGILTLSGAIFLASITGYLGPSYGPIDPMNLRPSKCFIIGCFPPLRSLW